MKMAKPSEKDIDAAGDLMSLLHQADRGDYPGDQGGAPDFFDEDDPEHLRAFYDAIKATLDKSPGYPGRVIGGMCYVIMFDKNEIIDPDSDVIELHPKLVAALAAPDVAPVARAGGLPDEPTVQRLAELHFYQDDAPTMDVRLRRFALAVVAHDRQHVAPVAGQGERERFEATWLQKYGHAATWNGQDGYVFHTEQRAWELWQAAISSPLADVKPVKYESRMRPTWVPDGTGWSAWTEISETSYQDQIRVPLLHDWQHEVRALYTAPVAPKEAQPVDAAAIVGQDGDEVEQRTERIRLAHGSPAIATRTKGALIRDVECLLAHIALLRHAAPNQPAQQDGDEQQRICLFNDLNRTYGNTTTAQANHLWACGYRKAVQPAQQAEARDAVLEEAANICGLYGMGKANDGYKAMADQADYLANKIRALKSNGPAAQGAAMASQPADGKAGA